MDSGQNESGSAFEQFGSDIPQQFPTQPAQQVSMPMQPVQQMDSVQPIRPPMGRYRPMMQPQPMMQGPMMPNAGGVDVGSRT